MKFLSMVCVLILGCSAQALTAKVVNSTDVRFMADLILTRASGGAPLSVVDDNVLAPGEAFEKNYGVLDTNELVLRYEVISTDNKPICMGKFDVTAKSNFKLVVDGHPGMAPAECKVTQ
ncbi:hypothetical protein [Bdellovibrio bacteriovorus]|uniref:hypothetical protein n=1 Tax=Bdellovibrio bacteriovorus TaxID=959 RepID=UPI003AA7DF10